MTIQHLAVQSISLFRELQFPLKQKDTACNEDSYSEVQKKIQELQEYITDNYYVCTKEILSGLGEMYKSIYNPSNIFTLIVAINV